MGYKLPKDATPNQIENYKMIKRIEEASRRIARAEKKRRRDNRE